MQKTAGTLWPRAASIAVLPWAWQREENLRADAAMAPIYLVEKRTLPLKQTGGSGSNSPGDLVNLSARVNWTRSEDWRLTLAVSRLGPSNWKEIAREIGTRTARQARDRWSNFLRPDLSHGPFTEEEDRLLMELQSELGNHWAAVAERMPGRGANQVKNRWYTTLCQRKAEEKPAAERKDACEALLPPAGLERLEEPWYGGGWELGDWLLPAEWDEERNW